MLIKIFVFAYVPKKHQSMIDTIFISQPFVKQSVVDLSIDGFNRFFKILTIDKGIVFHRDAVISNAICIYS